MAIYTNYGRYLKAKLFKEMLESQGDTYMLFGLGNPKWDDDSNIVQSITIAPYNTSIMTVGDVGSNQFYDNAVQCYFNIDGTSLPLQSISDSSPDTSTTEGLYLDKCKNLIPPFPCIWKYDTTTKVINSPEVLQHEYGQYYIKYVTSDYVLYKVVNTPPSPAEFPIQVPTDDLEKQYFAELYLRGKAIDKGIKTPVGLLGAVKCDISFVKDIGTEADNLYTGGINQFWYGDRYWQIVNPDDSDLDNYINDDPVGDRANQEIYPHHLIFTATVNPRVLCAELAIDKYIVPRQIAIYTRRVTGNNHRKNYYRVDENIFNFGQYATPENLASAAPTGGEFLDFTLPCTVDGRSYGGDFRFILNDYIRGQIRDDHSVDRFGYVVGF